MRVSCVCGNHGCSGSRQTSEPEPQHGCVAARMAFSHARQCAPSSHAVHALPSAVLISLIVSGGGLRRIDRFAGGRGKSLDEVGEEDLKGFLSHLAVEEGVSAATQRQALNAGVFFLREVRKMELGDFSDFVKADPRKYYPVVYSRDEIRRVLENLRDTWHLMGRLQYGCGLRVSELCRLRIKDVDVDRGKLYIRAGKGERDRVVPLPRSLHEAWKGHLKRVRPQWHLVKAVFRITIGIGIEIEIGSRFSIFLLAKALQTRSRFR